MISQTKINELTEKAKIIKKALKSKIKNEKMLINILSSTNNSERQIIRTCYKRLYNKPIQNDIKEELSNNFKEICLSMFDTPYEYDARELYKSLNANPIKFKIILEIFSCRNKAHLNIVNQAYEQFFKKTLREDIQKKISTKFYKFLLAIMDVPRGEGKTISSNNDAYKIAKIIKEKNFQIFDDENLFKNIFLEKSREDLILISRAFFELYEINLYDYIKSLKDGKFEEKNKKLIKGILFAVINPSEWFSKKLKKAIIELNTDYDRLNRIIIYRSEIDLDIIKEYYLLNNGNELNTNFQLIPEDSYREVLTNLCMK
jgi:hypothetical protein